MRALALTLLVAGACSLVGGVFAILNPGFATRAIVTFAALALALSGALQVIGAFSESDWRARAPSLLLAAAVLILGIAVLRNPAAGIAALTMMVGTLFLLSGVAKLLWGFVHRHDSSFWPLIISGGLSLLLAWLVYQNMAGGRSDILGTFLGVELMLNGLALVAVAALGIRVGRRLQQA